MIRRPTLALAAAVAFSACSHPAPAAIAATPVELATAAAPGTRAIYRGPGTVAAAHTYRIGFEIPGRVTSVRVDVGDRVAAGTVLATIDTSDYGAQYRAAAARAASAGAVLE
ncbi:MAG: biotin/lipoyl-binding protein, partial [Candidatus Velthaea sp.]